MFTSMNMSSSWVIMATCFHSKYCISFTIPGAMLVSGPTGRKKVGNSSWLDNLGDVEVVDTCMKTYHENDTMFNVVKSICVPPVPGSNMVPSLPLAEMPLNSLPQWWESPSHSCWWHAVWTHVLLACLCTIGMRKWEPYTAMAKMVMWYHISQCKLCMLVQRCNRATT